VGVLSGVRGGDPLSEVGGGAHEDDWLALSDDEQVRESDPCAGFLVACFLIPDDSRPVVDAVDFDHLSVAGVPTGDAFDVVADFDWLVAHVKESSGDFAPVKDLF